MGFAPPLESVWLASLMLVTSAVLAIAAARHAARKLRFVARAASATETDDARPAVFADAPGKVAMAVDAHTRELAESREQFREFVETANALPWQIDAESKCVDYIGPQCRALLGASPEETARRGLLEYVPAEDRGLLEQRLIDALVELERFEVDHRLVRADGRVLFVRSAVSAVEHAGRPVLRGLTIDVTERRKLELDLAQARRLESIGRLAAGIAHEINTPMQYLSCNITFVRESMKELGETLTPLRAAPALRAHGGIVDDVELTRDVDADRVAVERIDELSTLIAEALADSADAIVRIAAIVSSTKQLAHPGADRPQPADLNQAIETCLCVSRCEYKTVAEIERDLLAALPLVTCHISDVSQVLINLIVNAAHAIGERHGSSGAGRIAVRSFVEDGYACCAVSDNGSGIAPAVLERIFDPFFTTKGVGIGTGQGLALAQRVVVDRHRGRIDVDTEVGRGTTFTVRLPLGPHAGDNPRDRTVSDHAA